MKKKLAIACILFLITTCFMPVSTNIAMALEKGTVDFSPYGHIQDIVFLEEMLYVLTNQGLYMLNSWGDIVPLAPRQDIGDYSATLLVKGENQLAIWEYSTGKWYDVFGEAFSDEITIFPEEQEDLTSEPLLQFVNPLLLKDILIAGIQSDNENLLWIYHKVNKEEKIFPLQREMLPQSIRIYKNQLIIYDYTKGWVVFDPVSLSYGEVLFSNQIEEVSIDISQGVFWKDSFYYINKGKLYEYGKSSNQELVSFSGLTNKIAVSNTGWLVMQGDASTLMMLHIDEPIDITKQITIKVAGDFWAEDLPQSFFDEHPEVRIELINDTIDETAIVNNTGGVDLWLINDISLFGHMREKEYIAPITDAKLIENAQKMYPSIQRAIIHEKTGEVFTVL